MSVRKHLTPSATFAFLLLCGNASAQDTPPDETWISLENLLYPPYNVIAPKDFGDQSTYACLFYVLETDSGSVDMPALGYWVELAFPYGSWQPCQCNGNGLTKQSAIKTTDGSVEVSGIQTGETYFWSPRFLLGGGCVDPVRVANIPYNWIVTLITNPDFPGWYHADVPLPFVDEPIYSTIVAANSPDAVDPQSRFPWQANYMDSQTKCQVSLTDVVFVTPSFSRGIYYFCADFITGGNSPGGSKCDSIDCVYFTPYLKWGYQCVKN
jgi:hypothetical protein